MIKNHLIKLPEYLPHWGCNMSFWRSLSCSSVHPEWPAGHHCSWSHHWMWPSVLSSLLKLRLPQVLAVLCSSVLESDERKWFQLASVFRTVTRVNIYQHLLVHLLLYFIYCCFVRMLAVSHQAGFDIAACLKDVCQFQTMCHNQDICFFIIFIFVLSLTMVKSKKTNSQIWFVLVWMSFLCEQL